jgi:hypothetical protein
MSNRRRYVGQVWITSLVLFSAGCGPAEPQKANLAVTQQAVTGGDPFTVSGNPIISYDRTHYSSDPSVIVLDGFTQGEGPPQSLLTLVTSTDLVDFPTDNFPMDGTHLYTTFGNASPDPGKTMLDSTWYEYGAGDVVPGPVLQESDFDNWVHDGVNQLFAPDIQYVPGAGDTPSKLYIYVPDNDQGDTKRIGVASVVTPGGGSTLYDGTFAPKNGEPNDFFKILPGASTLPNNGLPPSNGWAIDPGVIHAQDNVAIPPGGKVQAQDAYFMAYVDTAFPQTGNLSLLKLTAPDMTAGVYQGKIGFSTYQSYSGLNQYMEGPDIHTLTTPSGNKNYYLVFVANVEPGATDTGYIGYAMCTPTEFWNNPTTCWRFKGWLFRNQHTGRNNQVSLAQFNGHYYVFFHRVQPILNTSTAQAISRSRQVCVKEIDVLDDPGQADDGEIRGVKPAANQNNAQDFTTLDGLTKGITKGFIQFRDETVGDKTVATVRLTGLNPLTIPGLPTGSSFRLFYYLDIEPGTNLTPALSAQSAGLQLAKPPLKHIGLRTWAVMLDYTQPPGLPNNNIGGLLTLRYDGSPTPTFDKSNDFSQPLDTYYTLTSRMSLMDTSGDLLAGEIPDINVPKHVRTAQLDANNQSTYLTVSFNDVDVGINNQYLKTGSLADQQTQQWIEEDASSFPYLSADDKTQAFRLRSVSAGFYMTGNDVTRIDPAHPEFFFLLSQALRPNWNTQVWIKDDIEPVNHFFRIRSAWKPYDSPPNFDARQFLTRDNTRTNNTGLQDVYVEPEDGANSRQTWFIEDIPVSVYLRTAVADADQKFTYLTVTNSAVNSGINSQYLNTTTASPEWVFERALDYPLPAGEDPSKAFRVRSAWTGFYMTSNDQTNRNPHFQTLDQALNTNPLWNTQVWIKESNPDGSFRLRSLFSPMGYPLYLTRFINDPNNIRGSQGVYVQPTDSTNAARQNWFIE